MKLPFFLFCSFFSITLASADWKIVDNTPAQSVDSPLIYERFTVSRAGDTSFFASKRIDVVWFDAKKHTFKVIDNGPAEATAFPNLAAAMKKHDCLAGCNGGFFLKDHSPSGLMIASGQSTGRFGEGALLSGVVLSSGKLNPYLLRRAEYGSKYQATDLIQTGPFLVDQGSPVGGLSKENARRRSFVLDDGGHWFAIGLSDSLTLAQLAEVIAHKEFSPSRKIHRGLNLDGGSSSGLYINRGESYPVLKVEPFKTVRNFLGIVPRNGK